MARMPVPMSAENGRLTVPTDIDLVCFSHLRWGFVFQRPQHLMTRHADERRTYYIEEPWLEDDVRQATYRFGEDKGVVWMTPVLPHGLSEAATERALRYLIDEFFEAQGITRFMAWYYSPMFLPVSVQLDPELVVYDCMDELSGFQDASRRLTLLERKMFKTADVVFTGGRSLWQAKRDKHADIHAFPSSIDREHFASARHRSPGPADQAGIPGPRLGYYGVIDERLDLELIASVADARPDWQIVMVGPVVKIDEEDLPHRDNIHWLGGKTYDELPSYLGGWDVALMPFARNESTRFISPTKTPEYLAGGVPVVSTSIADVVDPYGKKDLVHIADEPADFVDAVRIAMRDRHDAWWWWQVDLHLSGTSWDATWSGMTALVAKSYHGKHVESRWDELRDAIAASSAEPVASGVIG